MLTNQMKIEDINKTVYCLQRDITAAMRKTNGPATAELAVLVAYLVYKVRINNQLDDSYGYIKSNACTESDNLRMIIDKNFGREFWEELIGRISEEKYSNSDLFAVVFEDSLLDKFNTREKVSETPQSLINLGLKILEISEGEQVADLCSGLGSFIEKGLEICPNGNFIGYEKEFHFANICEMRLDILGKKATIENVDAISLFKKSHRIKMDKIFANSPLGMKLRSNLGNRPMAELLMGKYENITSTTSLDWIYNTLVSELLGEKGKAVCLMSRGSTWNSQDRGMRQYFVENGLIECVISLPERLFQNTGIATSMLVISHNNSRNIPIVDATSLFEKGRRVNELSEANIETILQAMKCEGELCQVIDYDTLKANDFTLNMTRYLKDKIEFENEVAFKEVIKDIKRGAPLKASELDKMTTDEATGVQYLMLSNVQSGEIVGKLPFLKDVDPKYEKYCVKNKDLLLSRNHSPYKVGVAKVGDDTKLIANGNLYIITLDEEKVDPYYMLAFFSSKAGNLALKSISVGTVITNISIKDLKELPVPMPEMKVQRAVAEAFCAKASEVRRLREKLAEAEKQLGECFDAGM